MHCVSYTQFHFCCSHFKRYFSKQKSISALFATINQQLSAPAQSDLRIDLLQENDSTRVLSAHWVGGSADFDDRDPEVYSPLSGHNLTYRTHSPVVQCNHRASRTRQQCRGHCARLNIVRKCIYRLRMLRAFQLWFVQVCGFYDWPKVSFLP